MQIAFTIPQLLSMSAALGYTPALAEAVNRVLQAKNEIEYNAAVYDATKEIFYGDTYFPELPKFMPLTFQKSGDIDQDLILESAVVEVRNSKNVVITEIQGRDGSIKELINNGDYQISIRGMFAFKGMDWPRENVKLLRQYMELGSSIKVSHELLENLGIYEIVITDWDLPESAFINIVSFTIQALSDNPAEYKLSGQ